MTPPRIELEHARGYAETWRYRGTVYVTLDDAALCFAVDLANEVVAQYAAFLRSKEDDKKLVMP